MRKNLPQANVQLFGFFSQIEQFLTTYTSTS